MRYKILVLIIFVVGCTDKKADDSLEQDQQIVLVNAGNENKEGLALMIGRIKECQPKIIGINLLFESNGERMDTALSNSIKESQKVVLASIYQDETYFRSDTLFRAACIGEGLLEFGVNDNNAVVKQMLFASVVDELKWSFPMTIASYYDPEKSVLAMNSVLGNEYYEIDFVSEDNDFSILDINSPAFGCESIRDKVVLIGLLGPGNEDTYLTPGGDKKYATWILANCIRDILNGHFVKVD